MNTNKRLLSVLVCLAMILSMFTSFAYAVDTGDIATQSETTGAVGNTGAKPTTNVAAPTVDANVIVVDSAATADTAYTLTWDGTEYADLTFTYGTNLFTTIDAAQAVAAAGSTYLVKSNGGNGDKVTIKVPGSFYSEAYNIMPFTVGTAFDGSDWSLNADYTAKSVTLTGVEFDYDAAELGTFSLYGFTLSYGSYAVDMNYCTGPMNVSIVNTYYVPTSSSATNWLSFGTFAKTEAAATSNVLVKNFYLGGSTSRFFTEYVPNNFTFDGFYFPANVDMGGTPYIKQGYNAAPSRIVFTNWNVQNEDMNIYFQGGDSKNWGNNPNTDSEVSGAYSNPYFRAIDITNCTLNNSAFYTMSSRCIYCYMNATSMYTLKNNRFINTTGTDNKLFVNNSPTYANHMGLDISDNYFKGYLAADSFASNVANGNSAGVKIYDNYLATCASDIGTDLYFDCTTDKYDWHSDDWYLDPDMSIKASDLADGITVTNGYIKQDNLKLTAYLPAGADTSSVVLPEGVTVEYDLANGTATVTRTINEVAYTVTFSFSVVQTTAPLFSISYDDPSDMIDASKALLITNAFNSTANGFVVETTWADDTVYSFIKGVNLFDTIEAASAYTLANDILDAHYLVLDISGTKGNSAPSQQFTMPGKYFTRNYNKNPYTKSDKALDPYGLQWASNINTENADSFVTANGISIKYLNLSKMAKAGDVEFYGFRITYTIEMNQSSAGTRADTSDMNVKFVNTFADLQGSLSLVYTDSLLNTAATAEKYNDSITFQNMYFASAQTAGFFRTDCWPVRNITFDGVFMDEGGATLAAAYLHTYTSDYSFTLKNSNFRNVTMPLYLRGHYGKSSDTKLNRSLEFDNNIFYNASLYEGSYFLAVYTGFYNKFTFTNNTVYAKQNGTYLRNAANSGGDTHPDITVTVKENVLNGFANEFNIARWMNPTASEVGYNWVSPVRDDPADGVTASGVTFTMINTSSQKEAGYEYSVDYYIDSAKTMLASEFAKKFEFKMPGGGVYKNDSALDLYISTGKSAADLALRDANATVVGWKDAEGTAAEATAITNANDGTAYTVTVGYPINGVIYTADFTVNVHANVVTGYAASTYVDRVPTHPTEKTELADIAHFPSGFEDPADLINADNAAFIDSDTGYGSTKYTIATGDYKVMNWNGVPYLTVMNTTLFVNIENAYTALTNKGVELPEYLIAGAEWGVQQGGYYSGTESNYTIRRPGKYFMPSYANKPYIKGDDKGNGWVSNIGTGEGQFNPDNAIKTGYIHIDDTSMAGVYELYGYTVASTIKDARSDIVNEIDLRFYNSYFESTGKVYDTILGYKTANVTNGTNRDSVTFKDSYILLTGGRSLLRNQGPANVTFDGVFVDATNQTYAGTRYFQQVYDDFKFEIKNSFFTGSTSANTYFEGYNNLGSGSVKAGTKQFILENNIFKNYSFYGASNLLILKHQYFTDITIKNNYVDNSGKSMYLFNNANLDSNGGKDASAKYTITENTLIGFNGNISSDTSIGRTLTEGSVISKNYTSLDSASVGTQLKADPLTGVYYLDAERTLLSDVVYDMTFNIGGASYGTDKDVEADVFLEKETINLADYLENEQYNKVTVYSAADTDFVDPLDIENIAVTKDIDLVVKYSSHDGTSEENSWYITLNILTSGDVTVDNQKSPGQDGSAFGREGYYRLSWKATVTGDIEASFVPSGEYVDHRVGAIYALGATAEEEAEAKAILEAYVAELNADTKEMSDLGSVIAGASYQQNVRIYELEENRAKWDSDAASYSYFYNITVKHERTRSVMMFAIYYDVEAEEYKITYSDFVTQTSPAAPVAE
ncbi:MAG: hypothetical protein IJ408_05635 [Clostridia bacterium]|nr:hypothetical protein [Clostridia bacterium]